jgi:hypothetical protein
MDESATRLTSLDAIRDDLEIVLRRMETDYGVAWKNTRFDRYLGHIAQAAVGPFPKTFEAEGATAQSVCESIGQAGQLLLSAGMWPRVDADLLHELFEHVMSGPDDEGRNFLLKLAVGGMLHAGGFAVQLTRDEDLVISTSKLVPLPVECRRPRSESSIEALVESVTARLGTRCARYTHGGLAAFGIDAGAGPSGEVVVVDSEADLKAETTRVTHAAAAELRRIGDAKLAAVAVSVFTFMAGCIFCRSQGRWLSVRRTAFAHIPNGSAQRAAVVRHLDRAVSGSPMSWDSR